MLYACFLVQIKIKKNHDICAIIMHVKVLASKIQEAIEDIQMFLLNMSFISRVKWTIFIFHEWQSHE